MVRIIFPVTRLKQHNGVQMASALQYGPEMPLHYTYCNKCWISKQIEDFMKYNHKGCQSELSFLPQRLPLRLCHFISTSFPMRLSVTHSLTEITRYSPFSCHDSWQWVMPWKPFLKNMMQGKFKWGKSDAYKSVSSRGYNKCLSGRRICMQTVSNKLTTPTRPWLSKYIAASWY